MIYQVYILQVPMEEQAMTSLVKFIEKHATTLASNLKFGKLLLAVFTKYTKQVRRFWFMYLYVIYFEIIRPQRLAIWCLNCEFICMNLVVNINSQNGNSSYILPFFQILPIHTSSLQNAVLCHETFLKKSLSASLKKLTGW